MSYVCQLCSSAFSESALEKRLRLDESAMCPTDHCMNDEPLIFASENLVEVTLVLSGKGYFVRKADSCYPRAAYTNTHILFEDNYKFMFLPEGFEYYVDTEYNLFSIEKNHGKIVSPIDKQREILKAVLALIDWAVSLPTNYGQFDGSSMSLEIDEL